MNRLGKFLVKWITMFLIIAVYMIFRNMIGWDESFNWSLFAEFSALGTLGVVLMGIYTKEKSDS